MIEAFFGHRWSALANQLSVSATRLRTGRSPRNEHTFSSTKLDEETRSEVWFLCAADRQPKCWVACRGITDPLL